MVSEYEGRAFDRVPNWDARNADHPLQLLAEPAEAVVERPLKTKTWTIPDVLDQGAEGACTGFGTSHMLSATPKARPGVDERFAHTLYKLAQTMDEWPGEDYDGSSVLGAMKAAKSKGYVTQYVWTRTAREVAVAIGYFGPVVIGVDWHQRMMNTDPEGFVHVDGRVVGGHCVALTGFSHTTGAFTFVNSWGEGWGRKGLGKLSYADLDRLLGTNGEAALATKASVK